MIQKLPHCSPRGWPAMLPSPSLGRPYRSKGDRAAAPGAWLRDRRESALPGRAMTNDRVEHGQQLAGDRDDGNFLGLAGCYEALEEDLEDRVVPPGHEGAHEQGCMHARPAAADEALAAPLARLPSEGGKAHKRGDVLAAEPAKLRQFGNERARDYRPDARHRAEQVHFLAPGRRATHAIVNIRLDVSRAAVPRRSSPRSDADGRQDRQVAGLLDRAAALV